MRLSYDKGFYHRKMSGLFVGPSNMTCDSNGIFESWFCTANRTFVTVAVFAFIRH
jgi:hypothetical protein